MKYIIRSRASNKIRQFYKNVAKKYSNSYSSNLMVQNIDAALNSIYQIENGLIRRNPTISRWRGLYMATTKDRKWNFAYRVEGDTIYVEDACHSQNMHESKKTIRLTETEFKQILVECITKIIKEIA